MTAPNGRFILGNVNPLAPLRSVGGRLAGLDEFIARWIERLRRRRYTGPPSPPDRLRPAEGP
jgi:hypothetical protein